MRPCSAVPIVCILLVAVVKTSSSCNGYSLKANSIKNCGDGDDVIQINSYDVILDKDCNIVPKGCATITKSFKTAQVHYTFSKPPMPDLSGTIDVCQLIGERQPIAQILRDFGFPDKCPVSAQKLCTNGDKKHNLGKLKNQLGLMAGNIKVKAEVRHDTGTSCIEVNLTLRKNRG